MKLLLLLLLLPSILPLSILAGAPSDSEHPIVKIAQTYIERLKNGQAADAAAEFWDIDAFMASSFGLMYLELPAAERKETQSAFAKFLAAPFSNPQLSQLFATVSIQSSRVMSYSDSLAGVTLELSGNEGKFHSINTLLFSKSGDRWRIIDQRQGASAPTRVAIVMLWLDARRESNATILSALEKASAQLQQTPAEKR